MIPGEASDLAVRIHQTWRNGPTADVWVDELRDLDYGRACTTYVRLRRERTHAPSVADFIKTYRTVATTDGGNAPEKCDLCLGQGWVDAPGFTANGHDYTAVRPCNCRNGQVVAKSSIWTHRR